jgi:hypothetical protein
MPSSRNSHRVPNCLLLLASASLPARCTLFCRGVDVRLEQSRIGDAVCTLQPEEDYIPRGCELVYAKKRELGVRDPPPAAAKLLEEFGRDAGLEGFESSDRLVERVADLSEVRCAIVQCVGLRLPGSLPRSRRFYSARWTPL